MPPITKLSFKPAPASILTDARGWQWVAVTMNGTVDWVRIA